MRSPDGYDVITLDPPLLVRHMACTEELIYRYAVQGPGIPGDSHGAIYARDAEGVKEIITKARAGVYGARK